MRRLLQLALSLVMAAFFVSAQAVRGPDEALVLGVFPNLSARAIVALYQPMQAHLEKSLQQRVQTYSAPDFKAFVERTFKREYDVVVLAPHLARLAQTEAGYVPLFRYSRELHAMIVVPESSPIRTLEDLRGKTLALPDRLAIIPVLGLRLLHNRGLTDGDFKIYSATSHSNAVLSLQRGEAQAAIIGSAPYAQLPEDLRESLRIVATSESIPNQFILASPDLPPARIAAVRKALLEFAASVEGRQFFERSGFNGLKPATEADLMKMETYARDVQSLMKAQP